MTTLRAFLDSREREINELMRELRRELTELRVARAALNPIPDDDQEESDEQGITIKSMIRAILRDKLLGLSSGEILAAINHEFGKDLERTSLSPQLSRLRRAGEVSLEHGRWFLNAEAQDETISREDLTRPVNTFANPFGARLGEDEQEEVLF